MAVKWKDTTLRASRSLPPPDKNVAGARGVRNHRLDNDAHKVSSCHRATSAGLTGLSVSQTSPLEIHMLYEISYKFPVELIKKIHFDTGTGKLPG